MAALLLNAYGALFYLLGLILLAATALAVTRRVLIHAVVFLAISFLDTALLFYLLGAPLLAVLEVIIYAGAIMVLFLFIVMTLGEQGGSAGRGPASASWVAAAFLALVSLGSALALLLAGPAPRGPLAMALARPADFGRVLLERYWLPVEIASFLLFVALVGALYLGRRARRPGERPE